MDAAIRQAVAIALAREPRLMGAFGGIEIGDDRGDLLLAGEVPDVAAKKVALEAAAGVAGVDRIIDRLHVSTGHPVADDELLDHVCEALAEDSSLHPVHVSPRADGPVRGEPLPQTADGRVITVSVHDGVVTLDGQVDSLAHKRLAGVLAWWVSGVRDVIDAIEVSPLEEDSDEEITEAVRLVLDKDRMVSATDVRVVTRNSTVMLAGFVSEDEERRRAENDAWCVFGVDRVHNLLALAAEAPVGQGGTSESQADWVRE
jgi:osmotically-inducible protein OsmY